MDETNHSPKIIVWDIETSLEQVYTFQMSRKFKGYIPAKNIISNTHLICACWKEVGKSKIHSVSLLDNEKLFNKDIHDDYYVVKTVANAIRDADILVAHNGDEFDLKTLNARLVYHNLPPLPKILTVDTKKKAKQIGQFPSNKLDDLAKFFGYDQKKDTDFELWVDCFNGSEKAISYMTRYCKQDVKINEKVYLRLRPYMRTHPNIASIGTRNCPKCNSDNVHRHKIRMMASGRRKIQMHCQDCGSYHTHSELLPEQPLSRI